MPTLRDLLAGGRTLLADGATGTALQLLGLPLGTASEAWNLSHPEQVAAVADAYAAAGSDLVWTNTFGGTPLRLAHTGLAGRCAEVNRAAVELAQRGAAGRALVIGSIGPTGELLEPYGDLAPEAARDAFAEQAEALVGAGVDGLVLETFSALEELGAALEAALAAAGELPVIASCSFDSGGRTMMGVKPAEAVRFALERGAAVVGANCSLGPHIVEPAIAEMLSAAPGARLLAKPNAGLPELRDGRPHYPLSPSDLAAFAGRMQAAGVAIVGGCCGSTAEHIAAMRAAMDG